MGGIQVLIVYRDQRKTSSVFFLQVISILVLWNSEGFHESWELLIRLACLASESETNQSSDYKHVYHWTSFQLTRDLIQVLVLNNNKDFYEVSHLFYP